MIYQRSIPCCVCVCVSLLVGWVESWRTSEGVLVGWNGLERKDGDVRDVGVLVTRYYLPGGLGRPVFRVVEGVPARYVPRKQTQQAEARSKTQTAWRRGGVGLGWEPEPESERQSDRATEDTGWIVDVRCACRTQNPTCWTVCRVVLGVQGC